MAVYFRQTGVLSLLPLLEALGETRDAGYGAALFHATLAEALAEWVAAKQGGNRVE